VKCNKALTENIKTAYLQEIQTPTLAMGRKQEARY